MERLLPLTEEEIRQGLKADGFASLEEFQEQVAEGIEEFAVDGAVGPLTRAAYYTHRRWRDAGLEVDWSGQAPLPDERPGPRETMETLIRNTPGERERTRMQRILDSTRFTDAPVGLYPRDCPPDRSVLI